MLSHILTIFIQYKQVECIGCAWQGFGSRGFTEVASVRSCWKLPPCLMEPVPAGSKSDPLLANAEPTSNGGRTSGITWLRTGKSCYATATAAREESSSVPLCFLLKNIAF